MIQINNVSKVYDSFSTVVRDVSMEVATGEIVVILGASGSGKTTLLKMINRLIEPSTGTIWMNGIDTAKMDPIMLRRSIGYVFQGVGLFPHLTVLDNITILKHLESVSVEQRTAEARTLLSCVNLEPDIFLDRFPDELSGGERQRVGVARALATNPALLLMDEPFGALDAINRSSIQSELLKLKNSLQKTILFVTHDILEAFFLGDRIAVMNKGCLEQIGDKKELIKSPATPFVQTLFEKVFDQFNEYMSVVNE